MQLRFFVQSPRHFEGGDWDQGGSCQRLKPLSPEQVEGLFTLNKNGTNVEARLVNRTHLHKALKRSNFHILDITHLSEFRADDHPSTAGGKKHDDFMHWYLPGMTDTWNDLLIAHLLNIKFLRNRATTAKGDGQSQTALFVQFCVSWVFLGIRVLFLCSN